MPNLFCLVSNSLEGEEASLIESSAAAADTAALYAFDAAAAAAAADTAALLALLAFDAAAAADTAALHAFDAAADTAALQHCPFQLVQKNIHPL